MPSIEKITADRFPEIHAEILCTWEPQIPDETWKRVFAPQWETDEGHFGYLLVNGGKIVGILGALFSRQWIDGRWERFCNLHSWSVKDEFRAQGLMLMRPVLALRDHTLTDFTATPRVAAISKRLGLQTLDEWAYVLPPLPHRRTTSDVTIEPVAAESLTSLAPGHIQDHEALAIHDHASSGCRHLLVSDSDARCLVSYSLVRRHRLPYCLVHSISDRELFARRHASIRRHILNELAGAYVVVDSRLIDGVRVPASFAVRAVEKLYRSPGLSPSQVGGLYSEMVLLEHTTLPGLRDRLSQALESYLPSAVRARIFRPQDLATL
jgi:hypothetical protein